MAAQVQAGANPSVAWALLIADTLALSVDDAVTPDTSRRAAEPRGRLGRPQRRAATLTELAVMESPACPTTSPDLDPRVRDYVSTERYH